MSVLKIRLTLLGTLEKDVLCQRKVPTCPQTRVASKFTQKFSLRVWQGGTIHHFPPRGLSCKAQSQKYIQAQRSHWAWAWPISAVLHLDIQGSHPGCNNSQICCSCCLIILSLISQTGSFLLALCLTGFSLTCHLDQVGMHISSRSYLISFSSQIYDSPVQ